MIIVKLYGGLGNQMFQHSLGRALSLKNGEKLRGDLSWFDNGTRDVSRPFKLGVFDFDLMEASPDEIGRLVPSKTKKVLGLYNHRRYIKEKNSVFDRAILDLRGDLYLDGYWQSEKYFKDFTSQILQDFQLAKPLHNPATDLANKIQNCHAVSLHIRRGDYVDNLKIRAYHGICTQDYYRKAIEIIKDRVSQPVFYAFSDDIEWVKKNFNVGVDLVPIDVHIEDHEAMKLMSLCQHNIIANSSFSWWGAWLNQNENKIVIAPAKWFNVPKDFRDIIPETWIKV